MEIEKKEAEVRLFDSSEELSSGFADYVHQISESAIKERGSFAIVLSGGDIPNRLGKLTRSPFLKMVEWSKWHVFWAEENVVAKRHPDSFYWQAKQCFLSKVPILPAHIVPVSHGVPGESAADSYEFSIRQQLRNRKVSVSASSDCPKFDLILLNPEVYGHVASLFLNYPVPGEKDTQWVTRHLIEGSKERVILTLPVINAADNVAVVASGAEVAPMFLDAMNGRNKPIGSTPAHRVWPKDGKLVWFVDSSAASLFLHGRGCAASSGS
ncbi:probable 6-phosphogluconolactonase 1 [Mercurialis annua]|uniref:probable 6-phosphogluconolactonase 1 n=1 Tax=Mercurialis annua TaxID=3986 RepID=UPI00215F5526|nr:probable 6-phosphogluconolactonase 1 [Mercurialis annua]